MRSLRELLPEGAEITKKENSFIIPHDFAVKRSYRMNVVGMGDVGRTFLLASKLLGNDILSSIGIYDLNEDMLRRLEMEMGQIRAASADVMFPEVEIIGEEDLFDADVFVFCATKRVPDVVAGKDPGDVRMAQFGANRPMIEAYAEMAAERDYKNMFFVVSDPVDPLAKAASLKLDMPERIQGCGLGVMNARAAYYAEKDPALRSYLEEGRAFGPHGEDLVIADSVKNYDETASQKLTDLTIGSNVAMRNIGFKPYIAPAVSSGALTVTEALRGRWHYSSVYFGSGSNGAFLGVKNRLTASGVEIEDLPLPDALFARVETAYRNLGAMI